MTEPRLVHAPAEPEPKKSLRTPSATIVEALRAYPEAVVHSEGHKTKNAARSAVKRIQSGAGNWGDVPEGHLRAFVAANPDGVTWDCAVLVRPF